jgi:hypothetical protein
MISTDYAPATDVESDSIFRDIYRVQVFLHAVKRCADCKQLQRVERFGRYGEQRCASCRERRAIYRGST